MKVIYIYNKKLECIFKPYITSLEEFKLNKNKFYSEWNDSMYYSEELISHPIIDDGVLRSKTYMERIKCGDEKLPDGQYIVDGEIILSEIPNDMIIPYWNIDKCLWEEKASEQEILEYKFKNDKSLYIKERNLVNVYMVEYNCGIRDDIDELNEVYDYLKSIYPDRYRRKTFSNESIKRPKVLETIEMEVNNHV